MNQVVATVEEIEKTDTITFLHLNSGEAKIRIIKHKAPKWLSVGDKVYCKFQEAAVCVSKGCAGNISIENKLPATLKDVRKSSSLCELTFESQMGKVVSLITCSAYDNLELEKGCKATMLLRGVDINVEPVLEQKMQTKKHTDN